MSRKPTISIIVPYGQLPTKETSVLRSEKIANTTRPRRERLFPFDQTAQAARGAPARTALRSSSR